MKNNYNALINCIKIVIISFVLLFHTSCSDNKPEITFNPIRFDQWVEKLPSYSPKIVVVDMWATWCASCIEQFPKMVHLSTKYSDQNVAFISMNLDDHRDSSALADAKNFLQTMDAQFDNYWMDENLMIAFEKLNLIGIPAVIIYDKEGTERFRLTGDDPNNQFTDTDIINAIETLLRQ